MTSHAISHVQSSTATAKLRTLGGGGEILQFCNSEIDFYSLTGLFVLTDS